MNSREFFNSVANGKSDFLQIFLSLLEKEAVGYCAIGGLAVNAYAEPVVSLDLDVVIAAERVGGLLSVFKSKYSVVEYPNSINVSDSSSDLRVQIQTDPRYQPFIKRASMRKVLGYDICVAAVEDVLQGKIWAALDGARRASKRQKDLADIMRLIETKRELLPLLPEAIKKELHL
ncbi:MAG: hypothetical protein KKH28_01295 [Elusimicrobia bacterium]|nr:hypothetical protein [Elusimicrobiota bacterium]